MKKLLTYLQVCLMVFTLALPTGVFAANEDVNNQILELRRQIEALTRQGEQYQGTINQKRREAGTLKREISIMTNQIYLLENKIAVTGKQISGTKLEITEMQSQIYTAERSIDKNKSSIADLLSLLDQRDQVSLLSALLQNPRLSNIASENERSARVNGSLLTLLTQNKQERDMLDAKRKELTQKKNNLEAFNNQQSIQKISLADNKIGKDKLLVVTKGQESKYQELLNDLEAKEAAFFEQLKTLEAQALVNGTTIVHITATSVPKRGTKLFQWPYTDSNYRTQGYGMTTYARRGGYGGAPHNGIDLVSGLGSAIHSIGDGTIAAAGYNSGFGNWVAVRHDNDMVSVYGHMRSAATITVGTRVNHDSILGYEGATGNVTGAHLHLSIYKDFFTYLKNGDFYFNYFNGSLNPLDYM